jgi:hypothetical protein
MKKTPSKKIHKAIHNTKSAVDKDPIVPGGPTLIDETLSEDKLAGDQFEVTGREDEATSTGHRVEPIINDEEGNAQKLIEEGLHGYMHRSKKDR